MSTNSGFAKFLRFLGIVLISLTGGFTLDFSKSKANQNKLAGGAALLWGLMTLTVKYVMASTHTWDGGNDAGAFDVFTTSSGVAVLCLGAEIIFGVEKVGGGVKQAAGRSEAVRNV